MTATASQRLLDQLSDAQRRLVETGTRNRLVHVNRTLSRANVLNLVNERADSVYTLLRREGKRLRFRATLPSIERLDRTAPLPAPETLDTVAAELRYNDTQLETPLTPEALAKRLLRLANDARTAEEEQGVNLLYLAIGFLTWIEPGSPPTPRHAPLVLLPVELVRNLRTSTYDVRVRDEDIATNLPLQERLLQDFALPLPEINEDEEWLPSRYFAEIQTLISQRAGWAIEADALQLGFFSFARLLMLHDLDPARWPRQQLLTNPLVSSLLGSGFPTEPARFDDQAQLDRVLDPAQLIHVVDADASQTRVIEEVRRGGNLVVQGPPGTGKSQTIANLIASAVYDGKSVLFVAEKAAALRVVYQRLVAVGLQDVCLELHSRSANKKAVVQELGRTLLAAQQALVPPEDPIKLREHRDLLNQISADLHAPLDGRDYSPFDALAMLVHLFGRQLPAPTQRIDSLAALRQADLDHLAQTVELFARLRLQVGPRDRHPFFGVRALDLQPPELQRLLHELDAALGAIDTARDTAAALLITLQLPVPAGFSAAAAGRVLLELLADAPPQAHTALEQLDHWSAQPELPQTLQMAEHWQATLRELREWCIDSALEQLDAAALSPLQRGLQQPLSRLSSAFQQASSAVQALLRPAAAQPPTSPFAEAVQTMHAPASARERDEARLSELFSTLQLAPPHDPAQLKHYQVLLERIAEAPTAAPSLIELLWPHVGDQRVLSALQAHQQWQLERLELELTFSYAAWSTDVSSYRAAMLRGAESFFARFGRAYRQSAAILGALLQQKPPRDAVARLALYDRIIAAQQQRAILTRDEALLQQTLQHEWLGDRTNFSGILTVARWLHDVQRMNLLQNATALADALTRFSDSAALAAALATLQAPAPAEHERLTRRIAVVEHLQAAAALRSTFRAAVPLLAELLGDSWLGAQTDYRGLLAALTWMQRARRLPLLHDLTDLRHALALPEIALRVQHLQERDAAITQRLAPVVELLALTPLPPEQLRDDTRLVELRDRLLRMQHEDGRYGEWALLQRAEQHLQQAGLSTFVALIDRDAPEPLSARDQLYYHVAEARWHEARLQRRSLEQIIQRDRHALVRLFRTAEEQRRREIPRLVLARYRRRLNEDPGPALAYLRGEVARKRRHKAIRQLMEQAAQTIQRVKPVFLMSPISVAQFLPAGAVTFDLLLIDEASQVRPEEALGTVARAKQIVVVGDQQQLPPTSFFERLTDNDAEEEFSETEEDDTVVPAARLADMESILTLCEARGLQRRMLEWHYRSRDPSLIRVSNAEFYHNRLVLPPSPLQRDGEYGMIFRRVSGIYHARGAAGGRGGTNRGEAEAVVAAAAAHAQRYPTQSLGIVTFSQTQRDMVMDVLDAARTRDTALDRLMTENNNEPLFVKNIENVQGDERDVILISVGYGPHEANGKLASMNFGPINGEGGARRLNVLFSRARNRCEVFASFDPDQIDLSRTTRDGPRVLKRFLTYARDGRSAEFSNLSDSVSGPFEQDIAAVVRSLGNYQLDEQLGSDGLRIDVAIRSGDAENRYLLAIVGDGANYRNAAWARERDRLRDAVLSGLGWRVHRIWSTDWYYRRAQEITRLRTALEQAAVELAGAAPILPGANSVATAAAAAPPPPAAAAGIDDVQRAELLNGALRSVAGPSAPAGHGAIIYRRAQVTVDAAIEVHEAPPELLERLVAEIVRQEGPLHHSEIARRVAAAFGKERTGTRINDIVDSALQRAQRAAPGTLLRLADFWLTPQQLAEPPVRDRRLDAALLKAELLPPHEVRAAAALLTIAADDRSAETLRAIARLLGFQRSGSELSEVILRALDGR